MHGAKADIDSVRSRVAFAKFAPQSKVHFLKQERLQEQFAFLQHNAGTPGRPGWELVARFR
jgi:hypothetical protein